MYTRNLVSPPFLGSSSPSAQFSLSIVTFTCIICIGTVSAIEPERARDAGAGRQHGCFVAVGPGAQGDRSPLPDGARVARRTRAVGQSACGRRELRRRRSPAARAFRRLRRPVSALSGATPAPAGASQWRQWQRSYGYGHGCECGRRLDTALEGESALAARRDGARTAARHAPHALAALSARVLPVRGQHGGHERLASPQSARTRPLCAARRSALESCASQTHSVSRCFHEVLKTDHTCTTVY